MDIWFCIVRSEQIHGSLWAYRLIKAIKATTNDTDRLFQEYQRFHYETPGIQTLLFLRAADETVFEGKGLNQ